MPGPESEYVFPPPVSHSQSQFSPESLALECFLVHWSTTKQVGSKELVHQSTTTPWFFGVPPGLLEHNFFAALRRTSSQSTTTLHHSDLSPDEPVLQGITFAVVLQRTGSSECYFPGDALTSRGQNDGGWWCSDGPVFF